MDRRFDKSSKKELISLVQRLECNIKTLQLTIRDLCNVIDEYNVAKDEINCTLKKGDEENE